MSFQFCIRKGASCCKNNTYFVDLFFLCNIYILSKEGVPEM